MSKLQEEYLAHYGVPGMQWDESKKKGNTSENIAARKRKLAQKSANVADNMAGSTGRSVSRYHLEQDSRSVSGLRKLNAYDNQGWGRDARVRLENNTYDKHVVAENMNNIANEVISKNKGTTPAQRRAAKKERMKQKLDNAMDTPLPTAKIAARKQKLKQKLSNAMSTPLPTSKIKAKGEANKKRLENSFGTPSATEKKKSSGGLSKEYLEERASNRKKNKYFER